MTALHPDSWRNHPLVFGTLGLCILADVAILVLCPLLGGDCLYGFFSLIVFPVVLSGPLGLWVPRNARGIADRVGALAPALPGARWLSGWPGEALVWVTGALALGAIITAAHVLAILGLNWFDYGGRLVRPWLLQIELGLAAVYYVALGAIAYAAAPRRQA